MRAGLVLVLAATLAGCGKPAPDAPPRPTPTVAPVIAGGWPAVFGDAPATVTTLNRLGFRLGDYRSVGRGYEAASLPTPMSDPSIKPANIAGLTVSGDARTLATLRFALDLRNLDSSPFAKTQFTRWIIQALGQLGVDGAAPVTRAIAAESTTRGALSGATYSVTREPIDGGRRLVVTFSRPAAMAGTSEPRKQ